MPLARLCPKKRSANILVNPNHFSVWKCTWQWRRRRTHPRAGKASNHSCSSFWNTDFPLAIEMQSTIPDSGCTLFRQQNHALITHHSCLSCSVHHRYPPSQIAEALATSGFLTTICIVGSLQSRLSPTRSFTCPASCPTFETCQMAFDSLGYSSLACSS